MNTAQGDELDRMASLFGLSRVEGETDQKLRNRLDAHFHGSDRATAHLSNAVMFDGVELTGFASGEYIEAGDDEPTVERTKPPTMCYVCAGDFRPGEMIVRLKSGVHVCKLCSEHI